MYNKTTARMSCVVPRPKCAAVTRDLSFAHRRSGYWPVIPDYLGTYQVGRNKLVVVLDSSSNKNESAEGRGEGVC